MIIATQSSASGLRTPATVTVRNASSGSGAPPLLTLIDRYGLGLEHEDSLLRFTVLNSDFPAKLSCSISGGGGAGQHDTVAQRPRNTIDATAPEPERPIATYERVWLRRRTNVPQAKIIYKHHLPELSDPRCARRLGEG